MNEPSTTYYYRDLSSPASHRHINIILASGHTRHHNSLAPVAPLSVQRERGLFFLRTTDWAQVPPNCLGCLSRLSLAVLAGGGDILFCSKQDNTPATTRGDILLTTRSS